IPTTFALVAEVVAPQRQAGAMARDEPLGLWKGWLCGWCGNGGEKRRERSEIPGASARFHRRRLRSIAASGTARAWERRRNYPIGTLAEFCSPAGYRDIRPGLVPTLD
ncbi:hypothetical protein, partial [Pseudomonas aeruginosa]|uniref:hypothetical protein n=1 Tax=Pseudomonas aeruginosa TaxID=287 RepID=UPI0039E81BF1